MKGLKIFLMLALSVFLFVPNAFGASLAKNEDAFWMYKDARRENLKEKFGLSEKEWDGLYCSVKDKLTNIYNDGSGAFTLVFEKGTTRTFFISDIQIKDLRIFGGILNNTHTYRFFCVSAAYRDDWQEIYDKKGKVYDQLLLVEP